jgi:glycine amidinotransferase
MSIVNSWNEWDPLEEVIVGVPDYACIYGEEPCFPDEKINHPDYKPGLKSAESIGKARFQIENFIRTLKDFQVTVKRPDIIDFSQGIKTPDFEVDNQFNAAIPRDVLITIGNSIYESTMCLRSRFFEHRAYKTILKDYFKRDPQFKWIVPPKPTMSDSLYDFNYPKKGVDNIKRKECIEKFRYTTTEYEPIFDVADILRLGKDIVVQQSFVTNKMGIEWLSRSLGSDFRVHTVHFPGEYTPWHIDVGLVAIKPPTNERRGILLVNPDYKMIESEKKVFLPNWEIKLAPEANHDSSTPLSNCGKWLSINSLMINPDTIVVEETEYNTIRFLESYGLKVIPLPYRDVYEFGGSFHCTTCDVRRRGKKESYFPNLD